MITDKSESHVCVGVDALINAYKESLSRVKLDGPTRFKPVMDRVLDLVQRQKQAGAPVYHVILMLTDGIIHDMRETIDLIVKASKMPVSIILIGIGDANFDNMDILDADEFKLVNSERKVAYRDIV